MSKCNVKKKEKILLSIDLTAKNIIIDDRLSRIFNFRRLSEYYSGIKVTAKHLCHARVIHTSVWYAKNRSSFWKKKKSLHDFMFSDTIQLARTVRRVSGPVRSGARYIILIANIWRNDRLQPLGVHDKD